MPDFQGIPIMPFTIVRPLKQFGIDYVMRIEAEPSEARVQNPVQEPRLQYDICYHAHQLDEGRTQLRLAWIKKV